jgi:hypothetical protein
VWLTFAEGKTIIFLQYAAEMAAAGCTRIPAPMSSPGRERSRVRGKLFDKIRLVETDRQTLQGSVTTNQGFTLSPRRIEYM